MYFPKEFFSKIKNDNEKIMLFVVFVGPFLSLSQVYTVWFESKEGVSKLTWMVFFITQIAYMIHSIKMKDKFNIIGGGYAWQLKPLYL